MPNNSLTRRRLLTAASLCCAAQVRSWKTAAADNLKPLSFVIVSDTHLGRKDNLSAEKNWRKAVDEINQLDAQFVLHLGDIVDSGREAQYPIYAETRKLLNKPVYEIPGNHDPVRLFTKYVAEKTDRTFDAEGVRFVLFNNAHRDSHDGFITDAQIRWLTQQCEAAAENGLKIVICCHVPIHTNRNPDRGWYVKPAEGQTAFYELQQQFADHLLMCLHGHFHNGIRGWRDHDRTVEVLCPSVCYNQNRNLTQHIADGKASGFFVDELRPGYVLAQLGNGKVSLRCKPLDNAANGEYTAQW